MEHIKTILIVLIILIIIIVMLLFSILNSQQLNMENSNEEFYENEVEIEYEVNNQIREVSNRNEYYAIKGILAKYLEYSTDVKNNNSQYSINIIKEILDEQYKKEYNISDDKIRKLSMDYDISDGIYIEKMYVIEKSSNIRIYYVYGSCNKISYKTIIKTDSYSNAFSIFPEEFITYNNYNENNLDTIDINTNDIIQTEFNKYKYVNISNKDMAVNYYDNYKKMIMNDIEKAYEMLDDNYKIIRFPSFNDFKEYIGNTLIETEVKVDSVIKTDNYIEYKCTDKYNNCFIFKEESFMKYTVQLDNYTLENEIFSEKYEKASSRDKGILNIDKFFKMINMQDYTSAYSVLDENFKQNYFKTQTDFENYMKNKVFKYNKVNYKEYSNKITDIYTYKVVLTDSTEEKQEEVEFNVVMKLLEGTKFVMSFEVK